MINENELAKELSAAMEPPTVKPRLVVRPGEAASVVANATDPDTERATRNLAEQTDKIITGIEKEIAEASEVRIRITRRITDLQIALAAEQLTLEVLRK